MGVTLRTPDGKVVTVADEDADRAVAQGYKPMDAAAQYDQAAVDATAAQGHAGASGAVNSALGGTLSGLTLGLSDRAIRSLTTKETADTIAADRASHPWAGGVGTIAGALAPTLLTGGASAGESAASAGESLLANSPSGLLSRAGAHVTALGEEGGAISKALAGAAGGAVEGAGQAGGAYLSQTALEDKPLSAEGFLGAMGNGAMFGGAAGGALSIGESTLLKARSLFPRSQVTREAADQAERDATSAVSDALDNGDALDLAAKRTLRENRAAKAASDLETAQKLNALKLSHQEALGATDVAAQKAIAEAKAAQISAKTDAQKKLADIQIQKAEAQLAKAKAPRPTRKAFGGDNEAPPKLPVSTRRAIDEQLGGAAPEAASAAPAAEPVSTGNLDDLNKVAAGGPLPAPTESAASSAPDALPITLMDPSDESITKWNEPTSEAQVDRLADDMKDQGWVGDPLVVVKDRYGGYRALTGSHRLAAAETAGIKVPVVEMDLPEGWKSTHEGLFRDHELMHSAHETLEALKEDGVPRRYLDLIDEEVSNRPRTVAAPGDDARIQQLQGTKAAVDNGSSISALSGGREARQAQQALEDAQDQVVGAVDPQHAKLVDATKELAASRKDLVQAWIKNARKGAAQDAEDLGYTTRYEDSFTGGKLGERGIMPRRTDRIVEPTAVESQTAAAAREKFLADYQNEPTLAEKIVNGEAIPPKRIISQGETPQGELEAYTRSDPDSIMETSRMQAADRGRDLDESIREALGQKIAEPRPFTIRVKGKSVPTGLSLVDEGAQREFEALGGTDAISVALRKRVGEHGSLAEDVAMLAPKISRFEKASADVAELVGPNAPPGAVKQAAEYRAAVEEQAQQSAATSAQHAASLDRGPAEVPQPEPLVKPAGAPKLNKPVASPPRGGALETAKNIGSVLELMHSLGVPGVPSVHDIPVIGPLLSMYLKARAASAVFRKLGGKLPASTEAIVASKAAATRDRMQAAVMKMLDVGAAGARAAQKIAPTSSALAVQLFDGKTLARTATDTPPPKNDDQREYQDRMHELAAAQQPGAIADTVRARVPTGDAALQQAIIDAQTRRLAFLQDKAPKATLPPTLLRAGATWTPTKAQLDTWGRYIAAAEDPASVLEQLADGGRVTMEGAETLRTVYPTLYREAQMTLLKAAPEMQAQLPYARRVSLSIMFQVPVDGTMTPSFVSFLRAGQPPAPQAPQGAAPPPPTISGAGVMTGTRTQTGLDRRAGA